MRVDILTLFPLIPLLVAAKHSKRRNHAWNENC